MTIKTRYLIFINLFLFLTFILSFTQIFTSDKREKIKTALVNPKNKLNIKNFYLSQNDKTLYFSKHEDFWSVSNDNINFIPAESNQIDKFLNHLIDVKMLYKVSSKISQNNNYGLLNSNQFEISYFVNENKNQIFWGNQNFSQTGRYFMTGKSTAVYEIDNSLENFLTTNLQFWADSNIISSEIIKKITAKDIQRILITKSDKTIIKTPTQEDFYEYASVLLSLNQGGIYSDLLKDENLLSVIKIETGSKEEVQINFYSTNIENTIALKTNYLKNSTVVFSANEKISNWTFNKIFE